MRKNTQKKQPKQSEELPIELESLDKADVDLVHFVLDALPPDDKIPGPPPSRTFLADCKERGIVCPIIVVRQPDGSYNLRAGRRRVKAARALGKTTIRALVFSNVGTLEALTIASAENAQRQPNPESDLEVIQQLVADGKPLRLSGMPKGTAQRWMKLLGLEPEFRQAMHDGKLAVSVAERVVKLSRDRRAKLIDRLQEGKRISATDVDDLKRVQVAQSAEVLGSVFNDIAAAAKQGTGFNPGYVVMDIRSREIVGQADEQDDAENISRSHLGMACKVFKLLEA